MAATLAATAMTVRAEPAPDSYARRLALAKVWLEVKIAHPAVVRNQVDPDAAMPAAIAKVDAATTKEAYAAAIKDLLASIHDPVTFVEDTSVAPAPAPPKITAGWIEHPTPKIAVVTPLALETEAPAKRGELFAKLPAELDGAEVIVVDLRAPGMEALVANLGYQLQTALPHADNGLIVRKVVHHGYRTQDVYRAAATTPGCSTAPSHHQSRIPDYTHTAAEQSFPRFLDGNPRNGEYFAA